MAMIGDDDEMLLCQVSVLLFICCSLRKRCVD